MCDFEANNLETLETHLVTCETYHCYACEIKAKQLKDIKEHVKIEHDSNVGIYHFKMNRNDEKFLRLAMNIMKSSFDSLECYIRVQIVLGKNPR